MELLKKNAWQKQEALCSEAWYTSPYLIQYRLANCKKWSLEGYFYSTFAVAMLPYSPAAESIREEMTN